MIAPTRTPGEFTHSVSWRRAQLAALEASGLTVSQCIIWGSGESFLARQQAMERASEHSWQVRQKWPGCLLEETSPRAVS